MQKIDRLVWAAGFSGTCFGTRIGIRANTAEALETLRPLLPVGWGYTPKPVVDLLFSYIGAGPTTRLGVKRFNILYLGAGRIARSLELKDITDTFEDVLQLLVAEAAPKHAFVQAGVVGWRGRAIVLPGFNQCGKTTLTAALVRAGASYYSDVYAVFNEQGKVQPFARPLQIRKGNGQRSKKVTAEELGGQCGEKPLPLGLVVETTFREDCQWRPRRGTIGRGAIALMAHAVPIQGRPQWTLNLLTRAVQESGYLKGTRGEADEAAGRILNEFADW